MLRNHVIVLSSFVPAHNKSPVAVNAKMLRLLCGAFEKVTFISANFQETVVDELESEGLEIINLPVHFNTAGEAESLFGYLKMQLLALPHLKRVADHNSIVVFWLSGPMILPFLYSKIHKWTTVGFLYGNSKFKAGLYNPFNRLKAWLMRYIALHAELSCVESPSVLTQWGYSPGDARFHTIHLFADSSFHESVAPESRPPVVGMCCRLEPNKRLLESIEAFHLLRQQHPEYRLQIIGSGSLDVACRKKINALGEAEAIEMLGWVEPSTLPAYFNSWRVLLHPTNYEGLPNSVIECMCCSTPAIASNVGGLSDVIEERRTGWFLAGNSSSAIHETLCAVLNGDEWVQVATAAGRFGRMHYNYDTALERLKSTFYSYDLSSTKKDEVVF